MAVLSGGKKKTIANVHCSLMLWKENGIADSWSVWKLRLEKLLLTKIQFKTFFWFIFMPLHISNENREIRKLFTRLHTFSLPIYSSTFTWEYELNCLLVYSLVGFQSGSTWKPKSSLRWITLSKLHFTRTFILQDFLALHIYSIYPLKILPLYCYWNL